MFTLQGCSRCAPMPEVCVKVSPTGRRAAVSATMHSQTVCTCIPAPAAHHMTEGGLRITAETLTGPCIPALKTPENVCWL